MAAMRLEAAGAIARLTFTDGPRGNPIDAQFCNEFCEAAIQLSVDRRVRAILLAAEGPNFSVGGDIGAFVGDLDGLAANIKRWTATLHSGIARLQRLDAMRDAGARLMGRDRIGRDVFLRATPEGLPLVKLRRWDASLYDLIAAYGQIRARGEPVVHIVARRAVMTLDEALVRLERLIGVQLEWASLQSFLPPTLDEGYRRSALASSFVASLELARMGKVALAQEEAFAPLMVRKA